MVRPDEAAALLCLSQREIFRRIEAATIHFEEASDGAVYICVNSLKLGGITSVVGGVGSGTVNIGNTTVADNRAITNKDVNGAIVSQGFNLVRTRGTSTRYVASDLPDGSNPALQALADNGGLTQTHRLPAGSAAVDAGSNALAVNPANGAALTIDQRGAGFPRIVDGNGDSIATVDIGAFESAFLTPTAATVSVSG